MILDRHSREHFDAAFSPRGIAIYGATSRPGAMGATLIDRLLSSKFGGNLALISQRRQQLGERSTILSATESDGALDHALIVVPSDSAPAALRDAAKANIKVATIFSSGFSEIGADGAALDAALRLAIKETGIRLLGPNCLGFISFRDNVSGSTLKIANVKPGPVSVVGQSGSVAARLATGVADTGTGLDLLVTMGNSIDVTPATMIDYLAGRESTKVVVLYLESLGPAEPLRAAIAAARAAGKEVVVLKSGRTEEGARTAESHTGASASKDVFVDILLRDAGAIRAKSVREACDVAALLARVGRLRGRALIVAPSGGDCTLAADRCSELGIPLAEIREETQRKLRAMVPICAPSNPVDPTTMGMREGAFLPFLKLVSEEPDVDYLIFMTSTTLVRPEASQNTLSGLYAVQEAGLPVVVGAPVSAESRAALSRPGIALVEDSERVFDIVRRVLDSSDETSRPREDRAERTAQSTPPTLMNELAALSALRDAGLPMVRTLSIGSEAELSSAAEKLGYPLVLKGILPQVGHKSGLGLVKLDLADREALGRAYGDVKQKLAAYPAAQIVVQPAIRGGIVELILGVVSDPELGKHVTLGIGGVLTDFYDGRVWAKAPLTRAQASQMFDQLSIAPGLRGKRQGVTACAEGVIDALVKISQWATDRDAEVGDVEINPLIVRKDDVVAVDALVTLKAAQGVEHA